MGRKRRTSGSDFGGQTVEGCAQGAAFGFFGGRGARHAVEDAAPLRFTGIKFVVDQFAGISPRPRLGGKALQHARPAALWLVVAVGMQGGIELGDRIPRGAFEGVTFQKLGVRRKFLRQ